MSAGTNGNPPQGARAFKMPVVGLSLPEAVVPSSSLIKLIIR